MGYMKIPNLYREQDVLQFKQVWVMEKVDGTSTNVRFKDNQLHFHAGGCTQASFEAIFNKEALLKAFQDYDVDDITVYGEGYGGSQQRMSQTYGPELKFIAFDIKIGDEWLTVDKMAKLAEQLGFEVVPFKVIDTHLDALNIERDRPSEVAIRRGMGDNKMREGIVIRPLIEATDRHGNRIIAKHKGDAFLERATPQPVVDLSKLKVLEEATAIATEWVNEERLRHVLDKLPEAKGMEHTKIVISAMIEDVYREAKGEIIESNPAKAAISKRTSELYKKHVQSMRAP